VTLGWSSAVDQPYRLIGLVSGKNVNFDNLTSFKI